MSLSDEIITRLSELRVGDANEAETRLKVIDDVVRHILNWQLEDITVEERVSEDGKDQYLDYLVRTAQTSFLIEAKRNSANFNSAPTSRRAALRGNWLKGDLRKAILQARDQGRALGVGFCVVTNGEAWIIFPINRRDLVSFEETFAVIFPDSRSALKDDVDDFKVLLSRDSVIDGSLEQQLLGGDSNQIESRRLNKIYDRSFSKISRTTMFSGIEDEIVTAFSEELVSNNPDMLAKAYVDTADRMKFDDRIKMAVLRHEHVLRSRPSRPIGKDGPEQVARKIIDIRIKSQPIALLTLGLVGAGKTTFFRYVEKVSGKNFFDQNRANPQGHWVHVDFRNFSKTQAPRNYIYDRIQEYISNNKTLGDFELCIKNAYSEEIKNLSRGPLAILKDDKDQLYRKITEIIMKEYDEKHLYCRRIMSYTSSIASTFLVIDNVDQIEDQRIQEDIFLEGLAIARDCGLNLVLAMRDATYVKNRSSAAFDAFTLDAIYIDPPNIESVISKRFTIAEQLLKGKSFDITTDQGLKINVRDASTVVEMVRSSVLGTDVGQIIEVAATGDVRMALQMTKQFLQFGYSTSYRSYQAFKQRGSYKFPVHEAIRAIMFGNQSIYRDEFSPIMNPFDAKTGRSESQFLRLYILSALVSAAGTKSFQGIEISEIVSALEKLGFSSRTTIKIVNDLIHFRTCFSRSHQEITTDSIIIPARLAGYIVRELISKLIFIETTLYDTFIYDDVFWSDIKDDMKYIYTENRPVQKFKRRKEVARRFFDWVETEVQKLCNEAAHRNLGPIWTTNAMTRASNAFKAELDRAFRSAVRNYGTARDQELVMLPLFQASNR